MSKSSKKQLGKRVEKIKSLAIRGEQPNKVEEIRNTFREDMLSDDDEIKEFHKLVAKSEKLTTNQSERMDKLLLKLSTRYGLQSGLWIRNLSYEKYLPALGKMRHDIAKEYSCKTASELMLADRIVASYWRAMKYDSFFNCLIEKPEGGYTFDQLKVNVLKEFNKGMELADRQLNADIILLKELKQPALKVNVKTNTAFVSQNQQFNINPEKNEIIEPK